jgi:uncharacterized protein YcnI
MGNHIRILRRRAGAVTLLAGGIVAALATAAWAHPAFLSSGSVPPNSDQKITMNVPEEKGPSVHNTRMVIVVPGGFSVAGCDQKPQWSCAVAPASNGRTTVTYTRTSGEDADGRVSFGVHTPGQTGDFPFNTIQDYSDNSSVHWDGPPDSDTPAPVLKVA